MFQPLWQTNRGICSWTALEARCPTTINLVIGAIFSTCAGTLGSIQPGLGMLRVSSWAQKVHSDLRQIDHLSSTPQAQSTAPSAVLTRPDAHTDRWAKRGHMGFFTIACRGSIVPEGLVESLFSQRSRTLFSPRVTLSPSAGPHDFVGTDASPPETRGPANCPVRPPEAHASPAGTKAQSRYSWPKIPAVLLSRESGRCPARSLASDLS